MIGMKTKLVYISGGDNCPPAEVKAALDEIRKSLDLPLDVVLFGIPVDASAQGSAAVQEPGFSSHKIIQFPNSSKKSIINVITNPDPDAEETDVTAIAKENFDEITMPDDVPLVVEDVDFDVSVSGPERSITDLMGEMPALGDDSLSQKSSLVEEFGNFLEHEPAQKKTEKKAKPFGRKGRGALNLLGDLFSYAGMAANDDAADFTLPDFIKRP